LYKPLLLVRKVAMTSILATIEQATGYSTCRDILNGMSG